MREALTEGLFVFFTLLFSMELFTRLMGLGVKEFWRDGWHRFDSVLVTLSFPDLFFSIAIAMGLYTPGEAQDDSANIVYLRVLRVLRMARVLRMMRVMRYWEGLNNIVQCLLSVGQPLVNICVLLFVLMTISFRLVRAVGGLTTVVILWMSGSLNQCFGT